MQKEHKPSTALSSPRRSPSGGEVQKGVGDQGLIPSAKHHPEISLLPQGQPWLVNAFGGNKNCNIWDYVPPEQKSLASILDLVSNEFI